MYPQSPWTPEKAGGYLSGVGHTSSTIDMMMVVAQYMSSSNMGSLFSRPESFIINLPILFKAFITIAFNYTCLELWKSRSKSWYVNSDSHVFFQLNSMALVEIIFQSEVIIIHKPHLLFRLNMFLFFIATNSRNMMAFFFLELETCNKKQSTFMQQCC